MQSTTFVLTKPWPPPRETGHSNGQAENSLLSLISTTETDYSLSERNFCLDPVTSGLGSTVPVLGRAAVHTEETEGAFMAHTAVLSLFLSLMERNILRY